MHLFNGKVYARVSDIIKPFSDFSRIDPQVLQRKAALGSSVHKLIYQEVQGELGEVGFKEEGYLQSFQKWRIAVDPLFAEMEQRYYCDETMVTGCIDALVTLKGEKKAVLIDFKTSVQESPIVWPMQAHLYYYLLQQNQKEVDKRFLFIKLNKDGDLPIVYQYKMEDSVMKRCMKAVEDFWDKDSDSFLVY